MKKNKFEKWFRNNWSEMILVAGLLIAIIFLYYGVTHPDHTAVEQCQANCESYSMPFLAYEMEDTHSGKCFCIDTADGKPRLIPGKG